MGGQLGKKKKGSPPVRRGRQSAGSGPQGQGWDHVAAWYDRLVGDEGSDYHQKVVLPAVVHMLGPQSGERFVDLCCGQGVLTRLLVKHGVGEVLAVDASTKLIQSAKARGETHGKVRYVVADARRLGVLADGSYDGAACVLAIQDVDDVEAVFRELGRALRDGGRVVVVMMHPCFRIPRQSSWEWDEHKRTQYRRLERYATPLAIPIATHPGSAPGEKTVFYHRPLAAYINALGAAGLAITACEELLSHRRAEPGSRSRGINRAAGEFPVFLALKAVKVVRCEGILH